MSDEGELTGLATTLVEGMVSGSTRYVLVLGHSCSGLDVLVKALRAQLDGHNATHAPHSMAHGEAQAYLGDGDVHVATHAMFSVMGYVNQNPPKLLEEVLPRHCFSEGGTIPICGVSKQLAEDVGGGVVVVLNTDVNDARAMRFVDRWVEHFGQCNGHRVLSLHAWYVPPYTNHPDNAPLLTRLASLEPYDKPFWPRVVCAPNAIWVVPDRTTAGRLCRLGQATQRCVSLSSSPVLRHYRSMFVTLEDSALPHNGRYDISTYTLSAPTDSSDSMKLLFKTRLLLNSHALGQFAFFPATAPSVSSEFHYILRIARRVTSRSAPFGLLFQTLRSIGWSISDPLPSLASCAPQLPPLAPVMSFRVGSWVRNTENGLLGSVVAFKGAPVPLQGLQHVEWPVVRYESSGVEVLELPQQAHAVSQVSGARISYLNVPLRSCFALAPQDVATCDVPVGSRAPSTRQHAPAALMPFALKLGMFGSRPSLLRYALRYSCRRFILHEACSFNTLRQNLATLTQHWQK